MMKEDKLHIKFCIVCGKEYFVSTCRLVSAKYCSQTCSHADQKGGKRPHTPEWDKKRIDAVRKYYETHDNKFKGKPRPIEYIKPMIDALGKKKKDDPQKYRDIAIRNLSKSKTLDLSKENSPWWQGGITKDWQKWRSENGKKLTEWSRGIHNRDNHKCRLCGSTTKLQAHHIMSIAEFRGLAFSPMNGILLCHECHKKTDTFGGKAIGKTKLDSDVFIKFIPHEYQVYNTCGNYERTDDGVLVIFVSDTGDTSMNFLIALHELTEEMLARKAGVTIKEITDFDLMFEKEREEGKHTADEEPGWDKRSPYRSHHAFAQKIERMVCEKLGIDWDSYNDTVMGL